MISQQQGPSIRDCCLRGKRSVARDPTRMQVAAAMGGDCPPIERQPSSPRARHQAGVFGACSSESCLPFLPLRPSNHRSPTQTLQELGESMGVWQTPFFRPPSLPLPLPLPPPPLPHFPVAAAPAQAPCPREGCRRSVESGRGPGFAPTAPGLGGRACGPCSCRSVNGLCTCRSVRAPLHQSVSPWSLPQSVGRSGSSESFGQSVVLASVSRSLGVS